MRMMEETHALFGDMVSSRVRERKEAKKGSGDAGVSTKNLQQPKTEDHRQAYPLSQRHLQLQRQRNGQRVRQQISKDVDGGVGQVKRIDVDALVRLARRLVPGRRDGRALKDGRQHVGRGLAGDDADHDNGQAAQGAVAESHVQGQGGDFDETQAGVVEEGGEPDDLGVGDEVVGAVVLFDVADVAS